MSRTAPADRAAPRQPPRRPTTTSAHDEAILTDSSGTGTGCTGDDLASPARLAVAPIHVLAAFANASNTTLLVQLTDRTDPVDLDDRLEDYDEHGPVDPLEVHPAADLAVYKPVRGQRPLWDFDAATLSGREVATALVDQRLGFGLVPPTAWRGEGPLGPGSLQAYVPHDAEENWFTWVAEERRDRDAMARLAVLDLVVNNTDRKGGHVLVGPDRIWAIDHGVTFHTEDKLRTVCWELQGEPIPTVLRERCVDLAGWLAEPPADLRRHLTPDEIEATRTRANAVALREDFPVLVHRGQLPWPLV